MFLHYFINNVLLVYKMEENMYNEYSKEINYFASKELYLHSIDKIDVERLAFLYVIAHPIHTVTTIDCQLNNLMLSFYSGKTNVESIGGEILDVIHKYIIERIELDLDDEISSLSWEKVLNFNTLLKKEIKNNAGRE